jgi:hypothetical protein
VLNGQQSFFSTGQGELFAKTATGIKTRSVSMLARYCGRRSHLGPKMIVEDAYKSPLFYPSIDSNTGFQTRNV